MAKRKAKLDVYEQESGKWSWRLVAGNGQTINSPHQGFVSRSNALRNYRTVKAAFAAGIDESGE